MDFDDAQCPACSAKIIRYEALEEFALMNIDIECSKCGVWVTPIKEVNGTFSLIRRKRLPINLSQISSRDEFKARKATGVKENVGIIIREEIRSVEEGVHKSFCGRCNRALAVDNNYCPNCGEERIRTSGPSAIGKMHEGTTPNVPEISEDEINSKKASDEISRLARLSSWSSWVAAFIVAVVINVLMANAAGVKPSKNIAWTVMWIYLSIEAWKQWRWKALLPYPIFIVASSISGLIMTGAGIDSFSSPFLVVKVILNIGGLILFYMLLRRPAGRI